MDAFDSNASILFSNMVGKNNYRVTYALFSFYLDLHWRLKLGVSIENNT